MQKLPFLRMLFTIPNQISFRLQVAESDASHYQEHVTLSTVSTQVWAVMLLTLSLVLIASLIAACTASCVFFLWHTVIPATLH